MMRVLQPSFRALFFLAVCLFCAPVLRAQNEEVFTLTRESLKDGQGVDFSTLAWKYHPGDDPAWADPKYDDRSWEVLKNTEFEPKTLPKSGWHGIGWFRLHLKMEPALVNQPVGFFLHQWGASEVYLDGRLVHRFGRVSASPEKEQPFDPSSFPVSLVFDTGPEHILCVRYSCTQLREMNPGHEGFYARLGYPAGFHFLFNRLDFSLSDAKQEVILPRAVFVGFVGVFIGISILHFFLFWFYPRQKANLYAALFAFSIALTPISTLLGQFGNGDLKRDLWFSALFHFSIFLTNVTLLPFLYAAFTSGIPKYFRIYFIFSTLLFILLVVVITANFLLWMGFLQSAFLFVETSRIVIQSIRQKKDGAWIVGGGIMLVFLFPIQGFLEFNGVHIWNVVRFTLPEVIQLAIVLSMSVYLARGFARTSLNLETQLEQVRVLSEQQLEREQRESELRLQREQEKARLALIEAESERRAKELEDAQLIRQKGEELAQTVEQLKISERKALDANRAKSIFLSNMSHELRTPLNAILGFSQLMDRKEQSPENRENLATILRSGEHLLGLINDVLSISKIEAGKLTLSETPFDLRSLIQGLEEMFAVRAKAKGLQLLCEMAPQVPRLVRGDEGKLRQVLINLLGNAVKFTEEGGLALRVGWQNGKAAFEVEDTGPGISEEDQTKLFVAFAQTHSGMQSKEGTGLGLAISRSFVQLMGGEFTVKSAVGQGTTFRFEISLPPADDAEIQPEMRKIIGLEAGQPPFRVLVVDDKLENRTLLVKMLAPLGFEVREAENGQESVEQWASWHPDLIWMDWRMPVMGGDEATKEIRQKAKGKRQKAKIQEQGSGQRTTDSGQPSETLNSQLSTLNSDPVIIALTASAFEHDREAILAAGCDDFVAKPFRDTTIFDVLAKHLGVRFVYEASQPEVAAQSFEPISIPARLAFLPAALVKELNQALVLGKDQMAYQVIDQIGAHDQPLGQELKQMVKNFQYDELQDLLERIPAG